MTKVKRFLGNDIDENRPFSEEWTKWMNSLNRWYDVCIDRESNWNRCFVAIREVIPNVQSWDDYRARHIPRQKLLYDAITAKCQVAIDWLAQHPEPEKYADPNAPKPPDERDMIMFGLFHDGGNCYHSGDDDYRWYWMTSEGETAAEFRARLRRAGERKAQQNYREYCKHPSYGAKVFKNLEQFKKAANKVGLHPDTKEYETNL